MQLVFNETGTHRHKDILKIRLDFYPSEDEKSYARNYVYLPVVTEKYPGKADACGFPADREDYKKWLESLPHIWHLNPCLSVFVAVDPAITKTRLSEFCADIYRPDVLATVDNIVTMPGSLHLVSPYMRQKTTLSTSNVARFDDADRLELNNLLKGFSYGSSIEESDDVKPQSIDIGPGAGNLTDSGSPAAYTMLAATNPANAAGTLDTIEIQAGSNLTGAKVGTFSGSSTTWNDRDYESIGSVTAGSVRQFTGLSIDVEAGDIIGAYAASGSIGGKAGTTMYLRSGDSFGQGGLSYSSYSDLEPCLYGTGKDASVVKIASETQSLADSFVRRSWSNRLVADTLGITESGLRRLRSVRLAGEAVSVAESLVKATLSSMIRILAETVSVGESYVDRLRSIRIISEAAGLSDGLLRRQRSVRAATEAEGIAESMERRSWSVRLFGEAISVTETFVAGVSGKIVKIAGEAVAISESVLRRARSLRLISETVSLVEQMITNLPVVGVLRYFISVLFPGKRADVKFPDKDTDVKFN